MTRTAIMAVCALLGAQWFVSSSWAQAEDQVAKAKPGAGKQSKYAQSPITISPETTVIHGPLMENGYVDYIAALNQLLSQGVTTENNAAVLLLRVTGPREIGRNRAQYCQMLGIPEMPLEGAYLVPADLFEVSAGDAEISKQRLTEHDLASKGPWTAKQIPTLARWLEQSAPQFEQIEQATRRTRYYTPLISGDPPSLVSVLLPQAQTSRTIARSLMIRSMFRLGKGDVAGAWQDIQSMHRLARLVGQGPTLIEGLVAIAIDSMAQAATIQVAQSEFLTPEWASTIMKDVEALKPVCVMVDKVNVAERFMFLDSVGLLLREGPHGLHTMLGEQPESAGMKMIGQFMMRSIDADKTLKMGNRWYDKLHANLSLPTFAERRAAAALTNKELTELQADTTGATAALTVLAGSGAERGELFADILVTMLLPAIQQVDVASERILVRRDQSMIALALRMYHMETGAFPADLGRLVPRYLPEVPSDRMSDQPIRYVAGEVRCKFSSPGNNGQYDTDLNDTDLNDTDLKSEGAPSDDLVVELNLEAGI